ncbi:hypothetical protein Tco_1268691 [Tanacetum coccineum]
MDDAKDKFKFFLDTKELTLIVADFRCIFQLPQATDNNNTEFVAAPSFNQMLTFFLVDLRFKLQLHLPSHFVSKGISQSWQTLCKIFARCFNHSSHRFTKIIVDHYMTKNQDISRRFHDNYHRVENDDLVKSIFNSGKNKEGEGMLILYCSQRSIEDFEAQQNVDKVKEHMVNEEIKQLVEGTENVNVDEYMEDIINS